MRSELRPLHRLAAFHGVETRYYDVNGSLVEPSPEALLAVLRALGSPVGSLDDLADALADAESLARRPVEPVQVARADQDVEVGIRIPTGAERLRYRLELENGEVREREIDLDTLHPRAAERQVGTDRETRGLPLGVLPEGYHRLRIEIGGLEAETTIIAAPGRVRPLFPDDEHRAWGVFLPLYALRSRRDLGSGDLSDLESLSRWAGEHGAEVVSTLPLLATFLDEPFDPSPFAPVSRMFWNELYLDPERVFEIEIADEARALLASPGFREEVARARDARLVNYGQVMALKRRVLSALAKSFFERAPDERRHEFDRFVGHYPRVEDYARFRAAVERNGGSWRRWPAPARDGVLTASDVDPDTVRYHLYVQWQLDEAFRRFDETAGDDGVRLALDFPVGVHPEGYDVWRERDVFAGGAAVGAPPDELFSGGQNWGFPPLHPGRSRETGHRYWRECLGRHMRCASLLRLDHVMGLHRMFWIPEGFDPSEGVYVRFPAEELYAVAALESKRHSCAVAGEDLGTVPGKVRPTMSRYGLDRSYVAQLELTEDPDAPLPAAPRAAIASLNTHDTPTFEGFWTERDIAERERLGLQDRETCRKMGARRKRQRGALLSYLRRRQQIRPDPGDEVVTAMTACLHELASGPARLVLVNVEDLWLEPEPHNVPGTRLERPNWRRKARYAIEEMGAVPEVEALLAAVDERRRGGV